MKQQPLTCPLDGPIPPDLYVLPDGCWYQVGDCDCLGADADCRWCRGSGRLMYQVSRCPTCRGTGVLFDDPDPEFGGRVLYCARCDDGYRFRPLWSAPAKILTEIVRMESWRHVRRSDVT